MRRPGPQETIITGRSIKLFSFQLSTRPRVDRQHVAQSERRRANIQDVPVPSMASRLGIWAIGRSVNAGCSMNLNRFLRGRPRGLSARRRGVAARSCHRRLGGSFGGRAESRAATKVIHHTQRTSKAWFIATSSRGTSCVIDGCGARSSMQPLPYGRGSESCRSGSSFDGSAEMRATPTPAADRSTRPAMPARPR